MSQDRFGLLLVRYLFVYSVFIFLTVFSKVPCWLFWVFRYFSNMNIFFLFIIYFWIEDELLSANNLLIFGLVIDVLSYTPLGLSSLSLLLAHKITKILNSYMMKDNSLFYFVRDVSMFFALYLLFRWFIFCYCSGVSFPFRFVLIDYGKNLLLSLLFYLVCSKTVGNTNLPNMMR